MRFDFEKSTGKAVEMSSNMDFAAMLNGQFANPRKGFNPGETVKARVVTIGKVYVMLDVNAKNVGLLPVEHVLDEEGEPTVKRDDVIEVSFISMQKDGFLFGKADVAKAAATITIGATAIITLFLILVLPLCLYVPMSRPPKRAGTMYAVAVLIAGVLRTGSRGLRTRTPIAMITIVSSDERAIAIVEMASDSGVLEVTPAIDCAEMATGNLRLRTLPVINVMYEAEPRIGAYEITSEKAEGTNIARSVPPAVITVESDGQQL